MQRFAVSFQLVAALHRGKRFANVLGFDITDGKPFATDNVIGSAAGNAFWFVGGVDMWRVQRFDQGFQGWPVGVFCGIA